MATSTRLLPLALALTAGCVLGPYTTTATHDSTSTTTAANSTGTTSTATTDPTTTTATTTATTTSSSTSSSTSGATTCAFPDCPDPSGDPWIECDLWTQNCPEGQKCMPWANDGSSAWNATKCTDIMPNAGKPGDPCTAEGNGVSGVDSCEKAAMCWNISQDTGMGACVAFCTGSLEAPVCPLGSHCVASRLLILCLPDCDPLAQDCPLMDLCIPQPMGDSFVCVLDASGAMGQQNDPCEYANSCDPGLGCVDPAFAAECDPMAPGCCLPFCDIDNPECTNKGAQCVSWYEPDPPPPGYEYFGVCRLPP